METNGKTHCARWVTSRLLLAAGLCISCRGELTGVGDSSSGGRLPTGQEIPSVCLDDSAPAMVGLTKLRRLTRDQLDAVVRDLLGLEARAAATLSPDERMGPFASNAIAPVTELLVQQTGELATRLANEAVTNLGILAPCDLSNDVGDPCARQFASEFAGRAYRRPLVAEEVDGLVSLYGLARDFGGVERGVALLIEAVLSSPSFLYHVETGLSGLPQLDPEPLDGSSLAARLSFFLWNSLPDDALLAAANRGDLSNPVVLEAEVDRMLADPRAAATVALFHRSWLAITGLDEKSKDPALYPEFGPDLARAMEQDLGRFASYTVLEGDARLATLFTASYGFPSEGLASVYGVTSSVDGAPVPLSPNERRGILTTPAFLARHAHGNQTSPVHRGIVVRENILCQPIAPPPANVATTLPPVNAATTTRERFTAHVANPSCAGCHELLDPPGLAFEHYDAIGRYRTFDGVNPVDASGTLTAVQPDLEGPFANGLELVDRLAEAAEVRECYSRQWFRFALGRVESEDDACTTAELYRRFSESGGDIRDLLRAIATSDAFTHIRSTALTEATP